LTIFEFFGFTGEELERRLRGAMIKSENTKIGFEKLLKR